MSSFAISMPGPFEWVVILVIVLLLFGVGRLPQVFEQLGKGIKSFKDAQRDEPEKPKEIPPPRATDAPEEHKPDR
jgi:sec-independent protein translocase protein TatA